MPNRKSHLQMCIVPGLAFSDTQFNLHNGSTSASISYISVQAFELNQKMQPQTTKSEMQVAFMRLTHHI